MNLDLILDQSYWSGRYNSSRTEWDAGAITPPLRDYFVQMASADQSRILIPGAGNSYEAEYLHTLGFTQVFVVDVAPEPLRAFHERVPSFPAEHLLLQDFFQLSVTPPFDLLVEQTFFCALPPTQRSAYAEKCSQLLRKGGTLMGVLFDTDFGPRQEPPFGGSRAEYRAYFESYFDFVHFETAYNSIKPRQGRELFVCLKKK